MWIIEPYYVPLLFLLEITLAQLAMLHTLKFLRKHVWRSALFKNVATLNTVTSLIVNAVIDIFLQILQNF